VSKYSSVVTTVTIDVVPAAAGCELTVDALREAILARHSNVPREEPTTQVWLTDGYDGAGHLVCVEVCPQLSRGSALHADYDDLRQVGPG
jgi:hypothetical protein